MAVKQRESAQVLAARECGFDCLSSGDRGDVEMTLDLKGQHKEEQ